MLPLNTLMDLWILSAVVLTGILLVLTGLHLVEESEESVLNIMHGSLITTTGGCLVIWVALTLVFHY